MYVFNNIIYREVYDSIVKRDKSMINYLIDFALRHHFTGNILKIYIAYVICYNENPFSISCENGGVMLGRHKLIIDDFKEFFDIYNDKFSDVENIDEVFDFQIIRHEEKYYDLEVSLVVIEFNKILENCKTPEEFYEASIKVYQTHGVGEFAFHKAFRITDEGDLIPVKNVLKVDINDIVGYEWQKERIINNTKSFCDGEDANNVLIYGDAGTGKSTTIKAVLNMFFDKGLRMIEVYKHQLNDVANLIATFKKRHYKFIIYMDDLSFEEHEIEYKHLKSIIEGGLEAKPQNVVVYATSNRRHLISESTADNLGSDIHRNETSAEKLSLANRFGLQIIFSSLSPIEFKNIVRELAKRNKINIPEEKLFIMANAWQLHYGNLSGRTAEQFIKYLKNGGEEI